MGYKSRRKFLGRERFWEKKKVVIIIWEKRNLLGKRPNI